MVDLQFKEEIPEVDKDPSSHSFGSALGEIRRSVKNLVQSESALARAELKESFSNLRKELIKEGIFSFLLVFSGLSFLAFLIIGLGRVLDDKYW
ncbi:MAG: phage holin family protein, partial [Bdellovibrionia bacterium]